MTWHKLILLYTTLNPPGPIFYFWNSNHKCLRFTINNYLWNLANWVGHNNASASAWRGMMVLTFFELAKTVIPLQSLTTEMIREPAPYGCITIKPEPLSSWLRPGWRNISWMPRKDGIPKRCLVRLKLLTF